MGSADLLQIAAQPRQIGVMLAGYRHIVWGSGHLETGQIKRTHFHRVIDEFIVILRLICAKTVQFGFQSGQGGGNTPIDITRTFGWLYFDTAG